MLTRLLQRLSDNQRAIATQTGVQIFGKMVTVLASILVLRMLTSVTGLNTSGYGDYALVVSYVAYFYLLLDFGFNSIFVQLSHHQPDKAGLFFSQLIGLRVLIALGLMALGLAGLAFLPSEPYGTSIKLGIMFCLPTVLFQAFFVSANGYFQLKMRYQLTVAVTVLAAAVNLMVVFVSMRLGAGLSGALTAFVIESCILGIGSMVLVRRFLPWKLVIDWAGMKHLFVSAVPLGLTIVLTIIYFRSDTFLLTVLPLDPSLGYSNKEAIALYSIPYAMFEVMLTLPAFLMNAVYPLMLKAYQESLDDLLALAKKTIMAAVGLALVLVLVVWVLAPLAIRIQTHNNPDFNASINILRLLSLGLPLFFVTNTLVWNLVTLQRKRWLPVVYILAGIFNISINLWLIPHFGMTAAAVTTGATELVILVLLLPLTWSAVKQIKRLPPDERPHNAVEESLG